MRLVDIDEERAIKSLTSTPQAKVLSKNPTTQGPMRDWVLALGA
jgi:hypothetical protein